MTINIILKIKIGQIIADARKCTVPSKIDDVPCQSTSNQKSNSYTDFDDIPNKSAQNYLQPNCTQSSDSNRLSYSQCMPQSDQQFYTNYSTDANYPNDNITNTTYFTENRYRSDIQEQKSPYQEMALTQNFDANTDEYQSNSNNIDYCLEQQNVGLVSNMHDQQWNDINTSAVDGEKDIALTFVYQQPGSRESYSSPTSYTTTPRKQYDP